MKKRIFLLTLILMFILSIPAQSGILWIKYGLFYPNCNSDLWETNFDNLLLQKSDFNTSQVFLTYEMPINRHLGISLDFGSIEKKEVDSEYRDYVYDDGTSINQAIRYKMGIFEINAKFYPMKKKEMIAPYLQIGAGFYSVEYNQWGEFIDFEGGYVYEGDFLSKTTSLGVNGAVGIIIRPTARFLLGVEGRYQMIKTTLSSEFEGFEPLDMSGASFSFMVGLIL